MLLSNHANGDEATLVARIPILIYADASIYAAVSPVHAMCRAKLRNNRPNLKFPIYFPSIATHQNGY